MPESHSYAFPIRPIVADDWVTESYIIASLVSFLVAVFFVIFGRDMMQRAQVHGHKHRNR